MKKANSKNKQPDDYIIYRQLKRRQKHKRNQRKKKIRIVRDLIIFSLIQLIIVYVGIVAFEGNVPVSIENTETDSFKADKVDSYDTYGLGRFSSHDTNIYIFHNNEKYLYCKLFSYQYDGDSLIDDLENEILSVTVQKGTNRVVELKGEKSFFYTIQDYNTTCIIRIILGVFVMLIVESIFLFALLFYIFYYYIPPVKVVTLKKLKFRDRKTGKTRKEKDRERQGTVPCLDTPHPTSLTKI